MENKNKDFKLHHRRKRMLTTSQMELFTNQIEELFNCTCVAVLHEVENPTPELVGASDHVDLLMLRSNDINGPGFLITMGASACPCPIKFDHRNQYVEFMMEVPRDWMSGSQLDNISKEFKWAITFMERNKRCLFEDDHIWFNDFITVKSSPFKNINTFLLTGPCLYTKDFIMPKVKIRRTDDVMIWQILPITNDERKWFLSNNCDRYLATLLTKVMLMQNVDPSNFNRESTDFDAYADFLGFRPEVNNNE